MSATEYVKKQLNQKKKENPAEYKNPSKKKPVYKSGNCKSK